MRTARSSDYQVIGNANPDFTLGFHSEVAWGKFDLSMMVRGSFGQDVFNNTALVYATKGNALQGKNFLRDALTDPIRLRDPAVYSSRWIESASFLRLQNVTIGYSFNIPSGVGAARSARVYLSGDNLLLLTGYSGLDPEVYNDVNIGGIITRGVDYLSYPRARTITGGVRVAF
jgi:iron complex outermembrane receptor protein